MAGGHAEGRGRSAQDIAVICKRREDWVRRRVRAYNEGGPEALLAELAAALKGKAPDGGLWTARKVVAWIQTKSGQGGSEPC